MQKLLLFLICMLKKRSVRNLKPSCPLAWLWVPSNGPQSQPPPSMPPQQLHQAVHQSFSIFPDQNKLHSFTLCTHLSALANNILSLLRGRIWWPNMCRDGRRFVQGCSDHLKEQSPCHLPTGKFHPLSISNQPWSYLGVDIIMDLPPSDGNACILWCRHVTCFFSRDCLQLLKLVNSSSILSSESSECQWILCQIMGPNSFPWYRKPFLTPTCDHKSLLR